MLLKFKREDVGLYFTMGLFGAGLGLVIGAVITAKILRDIDRDYDEEYLDDEEIEVNNARRRTDKLGPNLEMERARYDELVSLYSPNSLQVGLYKRGLVTIDEFEKVLMEEHNHAATKNNTYHSRYISTKPNLDEFVDEDEYDDIRYVITLDEPDEEAFLNPEVYFYDPENNGYYKIVNHQPIPIGDRLNLLIDETTADTIAPFVENGQRVFVFDQLRKRAMVFEELPDEMEDSSDNGNGH